LFLSCLNSCSVEEGSIFGDLNIGELELRYFETQCADPWYSDHTAGALGSREEKVNDLLAFFGNQGIDILAVGYQLDEEELIACLECHCLTGGIFYIKVADDPDLLEILIGMGFERI